MRKIKFFTTALILMAFSLSAFSQTQLDMTKETSDKYLKLDQELKKVYDQILVDYGNDTIFIEKLKNSQKIWIKLRDAELEMLFPDPDKRHYGSMYSMCCNGYLSNLTKERIVHLEKWIKPTPDGEGCTGSMKYRKIKKADGSTEIIDTNPKKN
jgi:uncharacterized protein YecT (DUF1311 family)